MNQRKIIVGIGEMVISKTRSDTLITHALGSCLGVTVYDRELAIGGLIHAKLPVFKDTTSGAHQKRAMFVNTGLVLLFDRLFMLGVQKENLLIKAAGCSNTNDDAFFNVGEKNFDVLQRFLLKNRLILHGEKIGGKQWRTMSLNLSDGKTTIRTADDTVFL